MAVQGVLGTPSPATSSEAPPLQSPREPESALGPLFYFLAGAVPLLVSLGRSTPTPVWRDDLALVRGLGFVQVGTEGAVSSLVTQCLSLAPLGGRLLRAGWVSAIAAGVAALILFRLTLGLLNRGGHSPRLAALLALSGALVTTLGSRWQLEATVPGGATVAAALVLSQLLLLDRVARDARSAALSGMLLGLTVFELHTAALAGVATVLVGLLGRGVTPSRRAVLCCAAGLAVTLALGAIPLFVGANPEGVALGRTLLSWQATGPQVARAEIALGWITSLGLISVATAGVGLLWGASRSPLRPIVMAMVALVLLDFVVPEPAFVQTSEDPRVVHRLLSVAALGVLSAMGVHTLVLGLHRARIYMARPASVLLVAVSVAFAFVAMESSSHAAERYRVRAAEVWTDEALASLPPRSFLLVRSEAAAWRLWAARVTRGEGVDLVVVPLPLLDSPSVSESLLGQEPALGPLIRELSVRGTPSEFALSSLADARPLYVEFDPSWDYRLLEHLSPHPFWMSFAPHALGRSDRVRDLEESRDTVARVLNAARSETTPDEATLRMLGERVREQAIMLGALGDRESVQVLLADLSLVPSEESRLSALEAALDERRGRTESLMKLLP